MTSFRGKPTKKHILWSRETRDGAARKRFDRDYFSRWAAHYDVDFDTDTRVDHDRSDDPRAQCRCVFTWERMESESVELGDEEWSFGQQRTPRTFIEIDEKGLARIRDWDDERVVDLRVLRHEGPVLFGERADGNNERLDARRLSQRPDD